MPLMYQYIFNADYHTIVFLKCSLAAISSFDMPSCKHLSLAEEFLANAIDTPFHIYRMAASALLPAMKFQRLPAHSREVSVAMIILPSWKNII